MTNIANLLTEHMAIWTAADTEKKTGRGRASGNAGSVYGVKKLRELILELAVRGKLVQQDNQNDSDDLKFVKLGEIVEVLDSLRKPVTKQDRVEGPYPYYGASGIVDYVSNYIFDEPLVLVGEDGAKWGAGENTAFMIEGKTWVNNHAHVIRPNRELVTDKFLTYCLVAMDLNEFITGMTVPKLNQARLVSIKIPLPPLAEQHCIVAKVDELMALCDQLEQQHSNAQEAHETLVSQLLATLTQSQNAAEFNANWQRIYAHFDVLFTTEASIDGLKQTLLQLAVMGKLVPQDHNDEKIEHLIKRIKKSENERVKNKEIQKPREQVTDSEPSISIPSSWCFKLLGEIAFVTKLAGFEYTEYINLKEIGEVPVIRAQNVRPFLPELENLKFIDLETSKKLFRSALDRECLLVTFIGAGIGDVCIFNRKERWHLAPNVAKVEPFGDVNVNYLNVFLNSPNGRSEIFKFMKSTAQPSLSMGTIREIWIPIPPIDEQHRIVAKIDELMALCDQLKTRIQQANQQQQAIADALVAQAVA